MQSLGNSGSFPFLVPTLPLGLAEAKLWACLCFSSSWKREENMEEPHTVPALAHIPLVRTPCMATFSCKGGWECTQLQFCYSSRTYLGRWLPLWTSYIFLCSLIHPSISYRSRPSLQGSFNLSSSWLGILRQVAQSL